MTSPATTGQRRALPWILSTALAAALAALVAQLAAAPGALLRLPLHDYAAFWSAARLNAQGLDPYDPEKLAPLQELGGSDPGALMVMWPAPWALAPLAPLARLDAQRSYLAWTVLQLGVLVAAGALGWRAYGGPPESRPVAWLVVFTFLPTFAVLATGQMGGWILLGLLGFLVLLKGGREAWAGAALVPAAVKPQLAFLFWIALLLWAVRERRWRLVAGGLIGTGAALAVPLWDNPHVVGQYADALLHRTASYTHQSPVPGTLLRLAFGMEHFWLQFVPMVPGLLWLAWYWRRHRDDWRWEERLPALLFASVLTAPYGAWPFDLVVLLPGVLQAAALAARSPNPGTARVALAWHVGVNGLAAVPLLAGMNLNYFAWMWLPPAVLLGRLVVIRSARGSTRAAVPGREPAAPPLAAALR